MREFTPTFSKARTCLGQVQIDGKLAEIHFGSVTILQSFSTPKASRNPIHIQTTSQPITCWLVQNLCVITSLKTHIRDGVELAWQHRRAGSIRFMPWIVQICRSVIFGATENQLRQPQIAVAFLNRFAIVRRAAGSRPTYRPNEPLEIIPANIKESKCITSWPKKKVRHENVKRIQKIF